MTTQQYIDNTNQCVEQAYGTLAIDINPKFGLARGSQVKVYRRADGQVEVESMEQPGQTAEINVYCLA